MSRPSPQRPRTQGPRGALRRAWGPALALALGAGPAEAYYAVAYGGQASKGDVSQTLVQESGSYDAYLGALGLGTKLGAFGLPGFRWEGEGVVAKHGGMERHWEATAALVLRWHRPPWHGVVPVGVAVGEGVSYATRRPEVEIERQDGRTRKLLNFLFFELTAALPAEGWSLFLRQHHRSGAFGTFGGVWGGSDYRCLGVRLDF